MTSATQHETVSVGSDRFCYEAMSAWQRLPAGWSLGEVAGVATDSRDRVFVFCRGEHPVIVFDREGNFLSSWGEGQFERPHGIFIGPDDSVYCTDDHGHAVRKYTPEGQLLLTLGTPGKPADTGVTRRDYRTIRRVGPPFNLPTNLALSPDGEMYVCDGYGNARIHKFSADGRLLFSWGEPGSGPGQFHVPHGVSVARDGTVYVSDRENSRIQLFAPDGRFLTEWTDVARACQIYIDANYTVFVAELGFLAGMPSGASHARSDSTGSRVSVFNHRGELQARWGGGSHPSAPGDFFAAHAICADSRGDLYVGEVAPGAGRADRPPASQQPPHDRHALQKFMRISR